MAVSRYSVGIGPAPVPPALSGSSTTRLKPPASARHRQPPSHQAVTELVACRPAPPDVVTLALSMVVRGLAVVVARLAVVVPSGTGGENVRPRAQVIGADQAPTANHPFQRAQPALVVTPALPRWVRGLPRADFGYQRLAEVFPLDTARVMERERHPERAALPGRGEHKLAIVPRRRGRPRRIEQVVAVSAPARVTHGAATLATPTMASRVTSAASSSSDRLSVPAGRSGSTMYRTSELESWTRTSMSSSRSRPNSRSTCCGSRTIRDR